MASMLGFIWFCARYGTFAAAFQTIDEDFCSMSGSVPSNGQYIGSSGPVVDILYTKVSL